MSSIEEVKAQLVLLELNLGEFISQATTLLDAILLARINTTNVTEGSSNPLLEKLNDELKGSYQAHTDGLTLTFNARDTVKDALGTM